MSEDTEFREALRRVLRQHDPDPDELRAAAEFLDTQADKWEQMEVAF